MKICFGGGCLVQYQPMMFVGRDPDRGLIFGYVKAIFWHQIRNDAPVVGDGKMDGGYPDIDDADESEANKKY